MYVLLSISLLIWLSGCINLDPKADPTRFYLITVKNEGKKAQIIDDDSGISIGLQRVDIPAYLNNRKIVVRYDTQEIRYAEYHRWGEDLEIAISRAVAVDLLKNDWVKRVSIVPWQDVAVHDLEVKIRIMRFDGDVRGKITLRALWEIKDPDSGKNLLSGDTTVNRSGWNSKDYERLAALMSETLATLSADLTAAISKLPPPSDDEAGEL